MVAMVPLLTPVSGYYTTFYNHIAMVLTPLRDLGKTMVEPHSILQGIRSVKHKLQSFEINKISLSCFDDKRYILNDDINSYAYGHYKIK